MRSLTHYTLVRNTVLAALTLIVTGFIASTTHAGAANATLLTFSKDVALPGVVLPAGTYRFEIANPDSSNDVVRVSTRNGSVQYQGFTFLVPRPAGAPNGPVMFKEARADSPVPILAWYPLGASNGHQFIYR